MTTASVLAAAMLAVALIPVAPRPAAADGGSGFVSMANGYRSDANLGAVALHAAVDQIAVERGRQLAANDELGHDFDYIQRRFDDLDICWRGFGEIVAFNGDGDFAHFGDQWYHSTTHRNIMLGDYTHAGGSREEVDGRWYGVMIFVKLCNASSSSQTTSGFVDLGTSPFISDIEWLVEHDITGGCRAYRFCPRDPVERGEMASFLQRAFGLPAASADFFVDDGASVHESAINRIREAEIAAGCRTVRFCPVAGVTRGEMASFLARALHLPVAARDYFSDDNWNVHEGAINRLAAAGIAGGCSASRFCPDQLVTREQMAGFLHRALD